MGLSGGLTKAASFFLVVIVTLWLASFFLWLETNPRRIDQVPLDSDEECLASRKEWPLFFLHVPKTGTSFLTTAYRWGCGIPLSDNEFHLEAKKGNWTHEKLPHTLRLVPDCNPRLFLERPNFLTGDKKFYGLAGSKDASAGTTWEVHDKVPFNDSHMDHVAQMFRDPAELMVSFFTWGRSYKPKHRDHLEGTVDGFKEWLKIYTWENGMQLRGTFGQKPARPPEDAFEKNHTIMFPVAKSRMERTGFIGLTDRFNESVVLFHLMFGGCPHDLQFANMRKTNTHDADIGAMIEIAREAVSWEDAEMFRLAEKKFERNALTYGLYEKARNPWYDRIYDAEGLLLG